MTQERKSVAALLAANTVVFTAVYLAASPDPQAFRIACNATVLLNLCVTLFYLARIVGTLGGPR